MNNKNDASLGAALKSNPFWMPVPSGKKKKSIENKGPTSFLALASGKSKTAKKNKKGPSHGGNFVGKPLASSTAYKVTALSTGNTTPQIKRNDNNLPSNSKTSSTKPETTTASNILELPADILTQGVLSFLTAKDLVSFGSTGSRGHSLIQEHSLWERLFRIDFKSFKSVVPVSVQEWQAVYKLASLGVMEKNRCYQSKKTFTECILGLGLDYTINPRTKCVDYISCSQDLLSFDAFQRLSKNTIVPSDTFGNKLKLFLPLYFSEDHFQRALPEIQKVLRKLCPERKTRGMFKPDMVLDVLPKIINSFIVLLSDEGVAASSKSFAAFTRIHRLFLALAKQYPSICKEALSRLNAFVRKEENRIKKNVPSLGLILPLLMIVNEQAFGWPQIRATFLSETFDRCALWIAKANPFLEKTPKESTMEEVHQRVDLSRKSMEFSNGTAAERSNLYDRMLFQRTKEEATANVGNKTLSVEAFQEAINEIILIESFQKFFRFIGLKGPQSKQEMSELLVTSVKNSRRKRYHKPGMDFSRVQARGTSRLLAKGQKYSASSDLKRVVFSDHWRFQGGVKYLDATVVLFKGKERVETVDYGRTYSQRGAVVHSGDVISNNTGTHTININLEAMDTSITSLVFVISAWNQATLSDITSASVTFRDSDVEDETPLCEYHLDAHDKVDSLKSVVMCKLYRKDDSWHVLAIGDAHKGDATYYEPIYKALKKYV
ncbi:MAG: hypothetical protein SGARI_000077 [Bacillariaceae sp.]